jgi:hypothetical protein
MCWLYSGLGHGQYLFWIPGNNTHKHTWGEFYAVLLGLLSNIPRYLFYYCYSERIGRRDIQCFTIAFKFPLCSAVFSALGILNHCIENKSPHAWGSSVLVNYLTCIAFTAQQMLFTAFTCTVSFNTYRWIDILIFLILQMMRLRKAFCK